MPGGVFEGFGKLLDAGNTYLQHQQFIERLRGMRLEDAKAQLAGYVRGMSDGQFNGLRLALTVVAKTRKDPITSKLLTALIGSLDAIRQGVTVDANPAASPSPVAALTAASPAAPPPRSFDDDLKMVGGWYDELDHDGRAAALLEHVRGLTPDGFRTFREHVGRMIENATKALRQHEANEDNAWGGFAEDRMSYMMARLQTGQRDPQFLARLRQLQDIVAFFEWVAKGADVIWSERESAATSGRSDVNVYIAALPMLRKVLEEQLASGMVPPERRAAYERHLDKMEGLLQRAADPRIDVDEQKKLLERFKGLMAEFQQSYLSPGATAQQVERLPDGVRARTLEGYVSEMKGVLYRELAQSPSQHTADHAGELMGDLTRAHQEIAQLADDEAAIAFERTMLRATAQGVHNFVHREHLLLVRPLWQCAEVMPSASGLFYAGGADLARTVGAIAARLKLDVSSTRGQYFGQARWDGLRTCHGGVFDLRGYRPGLVRADAAAAAALAAIAYELGLACALGKPVVIVTHAGDTLPFDVDIAPCELSGHGVADEQVLTDAIDHAWYGRQRTTSASSLADTLAFLDRATRDHPRRRMLEGSGALDASQIDDPIGFAGCVKQTLREQGLGDLQVIFPAWPGRYPDAAAPTAFHVMPFTEPWSDEVRDTVRATVSARGYVYRRGDESDEGRIIQAIWDDITAAHVVVVDLSGLNLNVSIELGMAHALGRTVVMVRRAGMNEPLPRNIEKLRVLEYDTPSALSGLIETRLKPAASAP